MLEIDVVTEESYDEERNEFVAGRTVRVVLEHSLVTLSKWEAVWQTPFLGREAKTPEQIISYIEMMIQGDKLPPEVFHNLLKNHNEEINKFIASEQSATRLPNPANAANYRETVTAELIRYWMMKLNVPPEYDRWHLNRLIMQIRVASHKETPQKPMSLQQRRELNRARLTKYGTPG